MNLYNADCFEVMAGLSDKSVDCVITDPPYGIDFQSHRRKEKYDKIQNDNDLSFLDDLNKELFRVMKDNTHIYQFCAFKTVDKFKISFEKYFELKNIIVWNKGNFGTGNYYRYKYEFCLFGIKGDRKIKSRAIPDVIDCDGTNNKLHPTQKPTNLIRILMEQSSDENEVVFDPFMGSGTTGEVAKMLNRDFIGCEINKEYFDIAQNRIMNGIKQPSADKFINSCGLFS